MGERRGRPGRGGGDRRPEPPAADVLRRARAGDAAAAEAVLAAVRPMVVQGAERWLRGGDVPTRDAAEDVAQLTLMRTAEHLVDCRAERPWQFVAWVLAIARRAAHDLRRVPFAETAPRRTPLDIVAEHLAEDDDVGEAEPELAARWAGPTDAADERPARSSATTVVVLRAALSTYATADALTAEILWMRLVVGAAWAEVGRALGLSTGAAKRRYQRAQVMLRRGTLRRLETLPGDVREQALALIREWES